MSIRIGINLASLQTQRQLGRSADLLGDISERLSSGLRINRASDDAAGLAIASQLNADSRIINQSIRNLNDAVSAISIAGGALEELSSITIRIAELAEQAANGSFNLPQRKALQSEADALTSEFNRIVESTTFNGISLLSAPGTRISMYAGTSTVNPISFTPGLELAQTAGDGTFTAQPTIASGMSQSVYARDVDRDGIFDLVNIGTASGVQVFRGNGDGTFGAAITYAMTGSGTTAAFGDINNDGLEDIAVSSTTGGSGLQVLLGTAAGGYGAASPFDIGVSSLATVLVDINGDSRLDVVKTDSTSAISIALGNGDGSFKAASNISTTSVTDVQAADINGDGIADLAVAQSGTSDTLLILIGNGNGTFKAGVTYATDDGPNRVPLVDVNRDGYLDIVVTTGTANNIAIHFGNANGTFGPKSSLPTGDAPVGIAVTDLNGDGYHDIIDIDAGTSDTYSVMLGNGNGTFKSRVSGAFGPSGGRNITVADFNGDGALDFASGGLSDNVIRFYLANTQEVPRLPYVNILTAADARTSLTTMDSALNRIAQERGYLGSIESRLNFAANQLRSNASNLIDASSRIMDADIAFETANLVRAQILTQAGSAILAQANKEPELVLQLLKAK
jgi:flagellin-like hook-associated protein FlgL